MLKVIAIIIGILVLYVLVSLIVFLYWELVHEIRKIRRQGKKTMWYSEWKFK